jgi:hypothetical protein
VQGLEALEDLDEVDPDDALVDVLPPLHVAVFLFGEGVGSVELIWMVCVCFGRGIGGQASRLGIMCCVFGTHRLIFMARSPHPQYSITMHRLFPSVWIFCVYDWSASQSVSHMRT